MATFVGATLYDGDDIDDYLAANHITPRRSVGGLVFQKFQEGGDGLTGDADDALYGDYGEGTAACDEADELLGLTYCSASRHSDLTNAIRDLAENAGQMAGSAGKGAAGEGA
ncbi:Ribosomal protein Rsm22 bacterial-type [Macrophomina phaseolina MS6]|uniref:Ribosomal protein Rsm22 bacterial-type n=1 Tax=Macrophomina phaseolina (strain MS6) TaxID=1126212 RepID=K2S4M9_MACPH|nr:Ribosomal protein Rsm22 bacterial-type [Macrophomina phaseolina MS6]